MDKWLKGLKESTFVFGLSRIRKLLKILGKEELDFLSIHITGSNGKGSTATFISSVLTEAGYKVGLYTSPHLVDFRERIKINNRMIPPKKLNILIEKVKEASKGLNITYFEAVTAIGFLYFACENVDIAVVEVGLGGRLDATNVITPKISIITSISLEHTNYLGNTIEKIAKEKSGIIKKGIPVVVGRMDEKACKVIERCANKKNSAIFIEGRDFTSYGNSYLFDVVFNDKVNKGLLLKMKGDHQVLNASLAVVALEVLKKDFPWNMKDLKNGLKSAYIEGRMTVISRKKPLIILDGAHNPDSAKILRKALDKYFFPYKPIFIIGILKDKDKEKFLSNLSISGCKVIVTQPKIDRAYPKEELFEIVKKYTKDVYLCKDIKNSLKYAKGIVQKDEVICVCGSLYLTGEVIGQSLVEKAKTDRLFSS